MSCLRKAGWIFALVCAAIMVGGSGSDIIGAESAEDLIGIADKIKNENPGIALEFWREGTKNEYKPGEEIVFGFTADKDCYVAIIDMGTSGKTTILFPNKWQTDNKAEKGKSYTIPPKDSKYALKVNGPAGLEKVKVLACVDPILGEVSSLQDELKKPVAQSEGGEAFLTMKNPALVLKDIAAVLKDIDPKKWATVEMSFDVVEK